MLTEVLLSTVQQHGSLQTFSEETMDFSGGKQDVLLKNPHFAGGPGGNWNICQVKEDKAPLATFLWKHGAELL
jgi:hypothetical protein